MSKMKQIAALTAMLVGVIMYASPAKSAVCFLPDDDGNCGGGDIEISDDSTSENQCADFNLSQNQRNSKEYDSDCYSCEPCTYNSRTTYKCALKNGATWYGGNLSVCCTNGEKYDSAEGKCCPAGGCVHECDAPKEWNSTSRRCVCPSGVETTTGVCCNDSEHADGAICCPEKKHNEGGVCKCDSQYNTDKNGNCVLPVEKNCSDINKDYKNKDQVYQCNIGSAPVFGVSGSDGQCYQCIKMIDKCLPRDYKIYYVVYPDYLQGDTAIHSGCSCFAYLVNGRSQNLDPVQTTAISTPENGSTSTKKIQLPAILTDVSSSNPYSVKIQENSCYGSEHCSAQAVKFDVFEAYAPETAKRLKENDDFTITGGITFSEAGYYYTGRQLKPKSQSINSCDDYVVILGNGNPKACAQISSDYYNYQEACPKGYEKKRLPNVYDSTGAQCYTCEKATPVITITYKETYNSLTPGADADPDEYYYKTLKFTSTSSDNVSRTIQMKTYPSKTCKTQYTTGQPVTIEENSETVIASLCGTKSAALPVSSVAALDTFINGTKVYSFEPYYSSNILYDGLDGKTVETNDYTVKFVKEKTCTPTCTSETGCKYGSKTQRDGCGGTCTVCYPPCAIGYWYGSLAQENCYIKPATYIKQPSNPNCSKCVCDNGKPDANGHYLQCQYF